MHDCSNGKNQQVWRARFDLTNNYYLMSRRALFIGIDDYPTDALNGCVKDAKAMFRLLEKHESGKPNFTCKLLVLSDGKPVTKERMQNAIEELFAHEADAALLYFSGHGSKNIYGGYFVSQDGTLATPGVAFKDILRLVKDSPVKEVTIIADCCHSGALGNTGDRRTKTVKIREGVSILTASTSDQFAWGNEFGGVFTSIIVNALEGQAADIRGIITAASIYYQADSLLTAWEQRPMFKSHLSRMKPLRRVKPKYPTSKLRKIREYFPTLDFEFRLSPEFEPDKSNMPPERRNINKAKEAMFSELQAMRALGLVEPKPPHKHMYFAALESGRCRLTRLGQFYWWLVEKKRF
jgi:hypothetical protein